MTLQTLKRLFWSFLAVMLGFSADVHAEPRAFTSLDGRPLQGEVLSATPDQVTLKLAAGPVLTLAIDKFSEADQAYIAEWRKANPAAIKYAFDASFTKEKTDSSKTTQSSSANNPHQENLKDTSVETLIINDTWVCHITVTNLSNQTLENVKVDYEVYYSQVNGKRVITRPYPGSVVIPVIKHLEKVTVPTQEIVLKTTKLEGGFYHLDGSRSVQKDSLKGVAIKIRHAGQSVFEWASSGVPKGRGAKVKK